MKILIVASGNHEKLAPFITEQAEALRQTGNKVMIHPVKGRGIVGYLRNYKSIKKVISGFSPDILHAHYGLCGLLCTLQHAVPVVVTFHGSDINSRYILPLSRLAMRRAAASIFVSTQLQQKAGSASRHSLVQPCGIDFDRFPLMDRQEARRALGLLPEGRYVLFAGAFHLKVKNAPLAQAACTLLPDTQLLELNQRTRDEVVQLMNASDALLLTSFHEGSPQVVKEALACNLPVVSVAVGDVPQQLNITQGGVIVDNTPEAIATALAPLLNQPRRTHAREHMEPYDNHIIAVKLCNLYNSILNE